jgi:hypothetical protein
MTLNESLAELKKEQDKLLEPGIMDNPDGLSKIMTYMSIVTGQIEAILASKERTYEQEVSQRMKYLLNSKMAVTKAEKLTKAETGLDKSVILYLKRTVDSSWKITSVLQSRIRHITSEWHTGKYQ